MAYNCIMNDNAILTTNRIFNTKEFDTKYFGPARWLDDDLGYTTLESAHSDKKVKEIIRYDIVSGDRSILITADQLIPPGTENPLIIKNYEWSSDKKLLLIFTNSKRVWRENTRGDYWIIDIDNAKLIQLGRDAKPSTLRFAKFSPDSSSVAYVHDNNIFVESLASGEITQLTTDGGDHIINGTSDWVYEEEFRLRDGFCWSPNGRFIAYWQFDTTGLQPFYMINNTDNLYPELITLPYPKVGTMNSSCRVGVIAAGGGETTWFEISGDPRNQYIPKMEWAANSKEVIIQQLSRLQNRNALLLGDITNGTTKTIFVDEDPAWIDVHDSLKWLAKGSTFTWLSDRDGWRHLFSISRDGKSISLLTPGNFDVIKVLKVDELSGWAYYIASPENPTQRYLYRSRLDGSGRTERITPPDQPGTHSYQISAKADYAFHTFSTSSSPPVISLISLPKHRPLRTLEGNKELHSALLGLDQPLIEFFRLDMGGGLQFDAWSIKPPKFDPENKYPLLFHVYGEPAGQTVLDTWGRKSKLWHLMLAQQGYLVISVDNRGTPAPRGRQWRKGVYRQVGITTASDQALAARKLIETRPYIDAKRVGVWGWSGGGSMTLNLMFKYPDIYKTGVAVAAVSDQRYYDTIYQERYMGLPDENQDGYSNGSPITFAKQLAGNLLLIHGTADDNVHYQCHEALVNELVKHDKHFSMMAYPNRSHAIKEGKNTLNHLYSLMTRYLNDNLMNLGL